MLHISHNSLNIRGKLILQEFNSSILRAITIQFRMPESVQVPEREEEAERAFPEASVGAKHATHADHCISVGSLLHRRQHLILYPAHHRGQYRSDRSCASRYITTWRPQAASQQSKPKGIFICADSWWRGLLAAVRARAGEKRGQPWPWLCAGWGLEWL